MSVPVAFSPYAKIIESVFVKRGDIGFLTIDESPVVKGKPHRGARAKYGRALHTEVGRIPGVYCWGGGTWGTPSPSPTPAPRPKPKVTLDRATRILLASNMDRTTAVWDAEHEDTSEDGDIGYAAEEYPYATAKILENGEVCEIGILTPHESLPPDRDFNRQFLRIIGSGVYGREDYFTINPKIGKNDHEK